MSDTNPVKGMLISVGGTAEPVAYSLDHYRPEKVIFFASSDSRKEIETGVRPRTTHRWVDHEVITVRDPQDLGHCMEMLAEKLPGCLVDLGLSMEGMLVDYTGGTKTMSAALVLATIHERVVYSYVGGTARTKEGLGVVMGGSERVVSNPNPWDVLEVEFRRRIAQQFNAARFAEARDTAAEAASRVGDRWRRFYVHLKDLFDAYHRWQGFELAQVLTPLRRSYQGLKDYTDAATLAPVQDFLEEVAADLARLEVLSPAFHALQKKGSPGAEGTRALVVDLVCNAVRVTRLANRPDDGVARLYSALEKLAKAELSALGIDNSAASPEQIPEGLRESFTPRYLDASSGCLQFGLNASYQLLAALGSPVGLRFREREQELEKVLATRNLSLMVHGWAPIKEDVFDQMLAVTLDFLGLTEGALPALPHFPAPHSGVSE